MQHFAIVAGLCGSLLALTAGTTQARLRYLTAQPLAPATFGIYWQVTDDTTAVEFVLGRKYNSDRYLEIARYDMSRRDTVDMVPCSLGDVVRYELREIDKSSGREISCLQAVAVAGTELIANGNFALAEVGAATTENIGLALPKPWTGEIISGGIGPDGKCLRLKTEQPFGAPRYGVTSRYYRVWPDTTYTFSWFTTETARGCAGGLGQAYGYTKEGTTSFYAKVASLYIYMSDRRGPWIQYWGQPKLPMDLHHVYVRLYPKGSYQPDPILIDEISIIDHDIELLQVTNIDDLIRQAESLSRSEHTALSSEKVGRYVAEILQHQKKMQNVTGLTIESFFAYRSQLCTAIRRLQREVELARLAELKHSGLE